MGPWDLRPLYNLLKEIGAKDRLAIVIQSPGGSADAAHGLMNLLREYADSLDVYVATYASSAATLFALGADNLWMGPSSEISPIDPQVPVDPNLLIPTLDPDSSSLSTDEPIHIPAHVIRDFLELTGVIEGDPTYPRPRVHTSRLESLLKPLNPWILGWYERADKVSRLYAKSALTEHLLVQHEADEEARAARATRIIGTLLDGFASHEAGILRSEARRIGIPVMDCPDDVWAKIEELSEYYDAVFWGQNVGRILETVNGFHVTANRPTRICPACGERNDAQDSFRFCHACGKPMFHECRTCQKPLRGDWAHCPRCGTSAPSDS